MHTRVPTSVALLSLFLLLSLCAPAFGQETGDEPARSRSAKGVVDPEGLSNLRTVLGVLTGRTDGFDEREFTTSMKRRRSVQELESAFRRLVKETGGFKNLGIIDHAPGLITTVVRAKKTGDRSRITVTYEEEKPFRIDGILIHPDLPTYDSWTEFTRTLDGFDADASVSIAQLLDDGSTETLFSYREDRALNIGSHARLFVFDAMVSAIESGDADWLTTLRVVDALKSPVPSATRDAEDGTVVPLSRLTRRMIVENDATAMDHLIDFLDRRTVERTAQRRVNERRRNSPFLSVRESLALRLVLSERARDRWADADESARRKTLEEIRGLEVAPGAYRAWSKPVALDHVGWFAGASVLNGLLADLYLTSRRESFAMVASALNELDPAPVDRTVWAYSRLLESVEPGVVASTWILGHRDGRVFVMSAVFNNAERAVSPPRVGMLLIAATETLARAAPRFESDRFLREQPGDSTDAPE